ncbi:hypothetical protein CRYUN_Cryun20dG0054400 [Craigia yunnanensis]
MYFGFGKLRRFALHKNDGKDKLDFLSSAHLENSRKQLSQKQLVVFQTGRDLNALVADAGANLIPRSNFQTGKADSCYNHAIVCSSLSCTHKDNAVELFRRACKIFNVDSE